MNTRTRGLLDSVFTVCTYSSVLLLIAVLVLVLGPMLKRGSGAFIFRGTVDFREKEMDMHGRGNEEALAKEKARTQAYRGEVYDLIEKFKSGIDTGNLSDQVNDINRQFGRDIRDKGIDGPEFFELRMLSREIRDNLRAAFESTKRDEINEKLDQVLEHSNDDRFAGTAAAEYFDIARLFKETAKNADLSRIREYLTELEELEAVVADMFGPRPGSSVPTRIMDRYGATRWDVALKGLDSFLFTYQWVETEPGEALQKIRKPRMEQFAGTELEKLFPYVEQNFSKFFNPRTTFYWQYFIDDSTAGRFFGGVGPEILGTLMLTLISMFFVVPLGIIAAAYLVECTCDNILVRIIRMGINTLAGVPSIVFGLFGMAFFILFLFPLLGMPSRPSVLAGALTLSLLTLPVMIRSSEEAIKAVPISYKQASLALGASEFRTFMTVTLPASLPGILTGAILSLSRVAGETAPILFTAAVALGPVPESIFHPTRALSYGSYDMAVGDRIAMTVPHKQFGMVVTLILLVLLMNGVSIIIRGHFFKKLQGR